MIKSAVVNVFGFTQGLLVWIYFVFGVYDVCINVLVLWINILFVPSVFKSLKFSELGSTFRFK